MIEDARKTAGYCVERHLGQGMPWSLTKMQWRMNKRNRRTRLKGRLMRDSTFEPIFRRNGRLDEGNLHASARAQVPKRPRGDLVGKELVWKCRIRDLLDH